MSRNTFETTSDVWLSVAVKVVILVTLLYGFTKIFIPLFTATKLILVF